MKKYFFSLFIFSSVFVQAQTLPLEEIMKGDDFIGHQPYNQRWSADGNTLYFEWNPKNEISGSTYYWQSGMQEPKVLDENTFDYSTVNMESQREFEEVFYVCRAMLHFL